MSASRPRAAFAVGLTGVLLAGLLLAGVLLAGCGPDAELSPQPDSPEQAVDAGTDDEVSADGGDDDPSGDDLSGDDADADADAAAADDSDADASGDADADASGDADADASGDDRDGAAANDREERSEDGETWTFGDGGDGETGSATQLPEEIDAVMDVPDSFEQYSRADASTSRGHQITVQGEVSGTREELLTRIEEGMRAEGWSRIELDDLVEDRPILRAEDEDRELEVTVSVSDGEDDGALTISYSWRE